MSETDVAAMYRQGASLIEVAAASGLSVSSVVRRLDKAGVVRRPRGMTRNRHAGNTARRLDLTEDVVSAYRRGDSVLELAEQHGVARGTIGRILTDAGIDLRGIGEAQVIRMTRLDSEERRALAAAAHAARRARGASTEERLAKAAHAEHRKHLVALGEAELAALMQARGLDPDPQVAVGARNIDLASAPVAIEVHRQTRHPLRDQKLTVRAAELVTAGWLVLYVWCAAGVRRGPGQVCFTDRCADEVVMHVERARTDRGNMPEVRILRCTGEDVHSPTTPSSVGRATN